MFAVGVQLRFDVGFICGVVWSSHKLCHMTPDCSLPDWYIGFSRFLENYT